MKNCKNTILSLFIVLSPLSALALGETERPTGITFAVQETDDEEANDISGPPVLQTVTITFTYDDAGNITKKTYHNFLLSLQQDEEEIEQSSLVDEYDVSIEADQSWAHVSISVNGSAAENTTLQVYNTAGAKCYSGRIDNAGITIDLSALPKGIYLFHVVAGEQSKTYKLIKH